MKISRRRNWVATSAASPFRTQPRVSTRCDIYGRASPRPLHTCKLGCPRGSSRSGWTTCSQAPTLRSRSQPGTTSCRNGVAVMASAGTCLGGGAGKRTGGSRKRTREERARMSLRMARMSKVRARRRLARKRRRRSSRWTPWTQCASRISSTSASASRSLRTSPGRIGPCSPSASSSTCSPMPSSVTSTIRTVWASIWSTSPSTTRSITRSP
mmetsp:Transcript_174018/g.552424  ORF Transcript_174018/g.552424 Transcript_174018/m.552424 type:complete len:212 (-) Transcript_174018:577-1212(-)